MSDSQTGAEYDQFVRAAKLVMIVMTLVTVAIVLICVLVAKGVGFPNCVGSEFRQGYRALDFLSLSICNAFLIFMFWRLLQKGHSTKSFFESESLEIFRILSTRITYGMLAFYTFLISASVISGLILGIAVANYWALITDCLNLIANN